MRKKLFFLLLSWSITILNAQIKEVPSAVSLEEAVEWGMIHNRTMQTANLELQKAQKLKWETLSIGFPQISANLNYQNNIEQPVSLIPAEFFGGQAGQFSEVTFGTKQSAMGSVELRQLLFDGTYVVGVQGIKHFLEIADNVLEKTQLEVERIIVESYLGALASKANVEIIERNIIAISSSVEEAHQLFKSGFGEEESVEQLRITHVSLSNELDYANNMVVLSNSVMKLLLGISFEKTLKLTDKLESLVIKNTTLETVDSGYENNIDLRIAENQITTEEIMYRLEKAKSLPSFTAFINGAYMGNNQTFAFTEKDQKWFGSSAFGVRVKIPIFSSFRRTASSQKAKIVLEQAKTSFQETKGKIHIEYKQATNNYQLAIKKHYNTKDQLDLAERIEKKNKTKFFEGLATSFELREAQIQLYSFQQNYIESMRDLLAKKTVLDIIINNNSQ
tara:strand:+ start:2051 stop:3394 length:1344 start_codon:yes stop_codon:yes gene_type:complete